MSPTGDTPDSGLRASDTPAAALRVSDTERRRRWRLVLGGVPDEDGTGKGITAMPLPGVDGRIDAALAAVYDQGVGRRAGGARAGGLGRSAPAVATS